MRREFQADHRPTALRWIGLVGPAAALLFAGSLIGFAAARSDGYTHGTKAVSELGTAGAAHAWAFNLLGFIIPGFLVVILAFAMARLARNRVRLIGPVLLGLSGLSLAAAGLFPADMADLSSASSTAHAAGAILTGVFWVIALFWLGPLLRDTVGAVRWGKITPWFGLFVFANLVWQILYQTGGPVLPGWGQRIGFAGMFFWVAITGLVLFRAKPRQGSV